MKRILFSLLAILVSFSLLMSFAACGGDKPKDEGNMETTAVVSDDSNVTEAPIDNEAVSYVVIPESEAVDSSFFDTAAFVGDSVSLKLSNYCDSTFALGNAQFFTSGSLGAGNALWELSDPESVHPTYQGEQMLIEDCVALSDADRVYIMLGMNDLGLYGVEETLANYKTLVDRILEKSSNVQIIVESMTPMTADSPIMGALNNDVIKEYNNELKSLCETEGWLYTDVASVMYDEAGEALRLEYCSDPDSMGIHFTDEGCEAWIDYLKTHTPK